MIDRSGMAWCIQEFGRDEMVQIAIEEWAGASPIYTKRMQRALNYEGDDVAHDLQGPAARHRRAAAVHGLPLHHPRPLARRVPPRPLRRAARRGADGRRLRLRHVPHHRGPDVRRHRGGDQPPRAGASHPPPAPGSVRPASALRLDRRHRRVLSAGRRASRRWTSLAQTRAATWELDAIDRSDEGLADYSGPLVSDFDFGAFSHSALVRMADEVCLQMHLLYLSFAIAVRARAGSDTELADSVGTRQLIGLAGLGAERIHRALSLPGGIDGVLRVFELHPLFNPLGYVNAETSGQLHVHRSPAHDDAAWISLCSPESVQPLQAIATAVDPHIEVRISGDSTDWTAELSETDTAATELPEVSVAKVSGGSTFQFQPRRSLPLTVV